MDFSFEKAESSQIPQIWTILKQAILRRKKDGSHQWQDGYPNLEVLQKDITTGIGYVLINEKEIAGYAAIRFNDEPAYDNLKGTWLTNGEFAVLHRLAVSDQYIGQGLAKRIVQFTEDLTLQNNIYSIKIDTNFDNAAMLKILESQGYTYCGEIKFRGGDRKAFEKVLSK